MKTRTQHLPPPTHDAWDAWSINPNVCDTIFVL